MDPPAARPRPPLKIAAAAIVARLTAHTFVDMGLRAVGLGAAICGLARPSPRVT